MRLTWPACVACLLTWGGAGRLLRTRLACLISVRQLFRHLFLIERGNSLDTQQATSEMDAEHRVFWMFWSPGALEVRVNHFPSASASDYTFSGMA